MTKPKLIGVLCNPNYPSVYSHPLIVFRNELRLLGFEFRFFSQIEDQRIIDCDYLIFHDQFYRDLLPKENRERNSAIEYLTPFFSKFEKVIWFDNNASPGWIRDYIIPYVNLYVKGQVLRDPDFYFEKHLIGSPHRDFVMENYGVVEKHNKKDPIDRKDINKIQISWNTSLKNWYSTRYKFIGNIQKTAKISGYLLPYRTPNLHSWGNMIPYRVEYWKNNPTVNWWRTVTKQKLEEFTRQNPAFYLSAPRRVNKLEYYQELRNGKVTVSPFGICETCYRDFEAFFCGSLLFKPDMDHLITWPDLFIDGVTYISHRWDFSDFNEKLEDILTHPERYEDIAREGQKRFRHALNDGAGFANHFQELISNSGNQVGLIK